MTPEAKIEKHSSKIDNLNERTTTLEHDLDNQKERITRHKDQLTQICDDLKKMIANHDNIIFGKEFNVGMLAMTKANNDYIKEQTSSKNKLVNFIYRTIIAAILSYVAIRVGLK